MFPTPRELKIWITLGLFLTICLGAPMRDEDEDVKELAREELRLLKK